MAIIIIVINICKTRIKGILQKLKENFKTKMYMIIILKSFKYFMYANCYLKLP